MLSLYKQSFTLRKLYLRVDTIIVLYYFISILSEQSVYLPFKFGSFNSRPCYPSLKLFPLYLFLSLAKLASYFLRPNSLELKKV